MREAASRNDDPQARPAQLAALAKNTSDSLLPHQLTVGRHDAGHGGKPGDAVLQETARPTSTLAILALLAVGCDDGCDDAGADPGHDRPP